MRTPYSTLDLTPGFGTGSGNYAPADRGVRSVGTDRRTGRQARRAERRRRRAQYRADMQQARAYDRARRRGEPVPSSITFRDAGMPCAGVSYAAPFDTGDLQDDLHAQALAELAGPDAAREYLAEKAAREAADGAAGVTKAVVVIGALYLMGELLWP